MYLRPVSDKSEHVRVGMQSIDRRAPGQQRRGEVMAEEEQQAWQAAETRQGSVAQAGKRTCSSRRALCTRENLAEV